MNKIVIVISVFVAVGLGAFLFLNDTPVLQEETQTVGTSQDTEEVIKEIVEEGEETGGVGTTSNKETAVVHNGCTRPFSPKYSTSPHYTGPLFDAHFHMPDLIDVGALHEGEGAHGGSEHLRSTADAHQGKPVVSESLVTKILCTFGKENVRGAIGFATGAEPAQAETIQGAQLVKSLAGGRINLFLTPAMYSTDGLDSFTANNRDLFAGFGEIAFYNPFYSATPPDASSVMSTYRIAEKNKYVVMMHPDARQENAVERAVKANPNVTFLIHGPEIENGIHGIVGKYPNAFYSIDATLIRHNSPGALLYTVGSKNEFKSTFAQNYSSMMGDALRKWKSRIEQYPEKYMWGTDRDASGWMIDEDVGVLLEEFARDFIAELDPAVQEKFAYKNAERILGK